LSEILSSLGKEVFNIGGGALLGALIFCVGRIISMVAYYLWVTLGQKLTGNYGPWNSFEFREFYHWLHRYSYEPIMMFFIGGIVGYVVDLSSYDLGMCLLSSFCLQLLWRLIQRSLGPCI